MRLVIESNRIYGPSDPGGIVSGATRNLLKRVRDPFWKARDIVASTFVAEFDGVSNVIDTTISRTQSAVITYVDGARFPKQLGDDQFVTVRRPGMPNQILTTSGDVYSCVPIATEMEAVEMKMSDALEATGFTFSPNELFKFPMHKYVVRQLQMQQIFGANADAYFNFANRLTRHGPVEHLLSAVQPDAELRTLAMLSGTIPFREAVANDEISVLLEALQLPSMSAYATLVAKVNSLQAMRRMTILNSSDDNRGLGILLFYATMHPSYITRLPKDVLLALAHPNSEGIATVNTIDNASTATLTVQLDPSVLPQVPTLASITDDDLDAITRGRILYKMLCVMRLIQMRGVNPTLTYTLPEADRAKLFNLML